MLAHILATVFIISMFGLGLGNMLIFCFGRNKQFNAVIALVLFAIAAIMLIAGLHFGLD